MTWADVKSQTAITDGLWYCANNAETITISGDMATVSNVTRKATTSAHDDDTGLQTYTVYQGSGSAVIDQCTFQGLLNDAVGLDAQSSGRGVGGIAGSNYATVSNCFAYNNIVNCYACSGGIVGINSGSVVNCASASYFVDSYVNDGLGETVGLNNGGTVTNCYFDNANGAGVYGNAGGGTGIDLMAATSLPGFDSEFWSIASGAHPVLINAAEFL